MDMCHLPGSSKSWTVYWVVLLLLCNLNVLLLLLL